MAEMKTTASNLIRAIKEAEQKKTSGYDTTAEVVRIDEQTAWVHIPGGVDETPVALTISAEVGDTVQIRVAGGSAWITGNRSKPPTDDTTAVRARGIATAAQTTADEAQETAEAVEGIAVDAKETAAEAESKAEDALSQVGASITTDTLHYLATSADSGVTINTPGWTTTVQSMDSTNRYLWTYHTYHKASGQSINTQPVITGVYGQQGQQGPQGPTGPAGSDGDDGVSVTAVQPEYYLSTSASSATGGTWSTSLTYETGKYIWTREHITYSDSSTGYSSEIYNEALTGACSTAEQALNIAEGVDEHFWYDNTGAHVTRVTQDDWNDSTSPNYHSGGNTLITSTGMAIRNGMTELATFGASQAVIGQNANGKSRTEIGADGIHIIQKDSGGTDVQISHLGYGAGTDSQGGTSNAPYYSLGTRIGTVGNYSVAEGNNSTASGFASHAEGWNAVASGSYSHAEGLESDANDMASHAEGFRTTASQAYSHAEGYGTTASGSGAHAEGFESVANEMTSHAEGYGTTASGSSAHAEGYETTASRSSAHAEGYETTASDFASHAEGNATTASGRCSHAQNSGTIAQRKSQTALGEFNVADTSGADGTVRGDHALIIGNGTADNARSNALTVAWTGDVEASGDITDGSNNVLSSKADSAGFFKEVDLSWTEPAINAHSHGTNTTHTVPTADRPDGMTLVGIVGWTSGNYRIYPYVFHTNGANSISVTMANATAANSASATVHAYLLYIKATSA